jgi:phosphopantothenoylcysteine decarboxylase/phosphopantothenate--cysteine ligase
MAAAVSDFKFEQTAVQKIKKQKDPGLIKLVPTGDILEKLGRTKGNKILVGFAAETERKNLKENALQKAEAKNLDLIVANDVSQEDIGFDSEMNMVTIFHRGGKTISTEKQTKHEISRIILDEIEGLIESHQK